MGCNTSSANAIRNLDTDPETANTGNAPIESSVNNIKENKVTSNTNKNGVKKVLKSSIHENGKNSSNDKDDQEDVNKSDRISLSSSSSSSDSDIDYPDIVDTENGKEHLGKAGEWPSTTSTTTGQQDEIVVIHTNNVDDQEQL